ncbi:MAG: DUF2271 domain-containing protein [Planctomycetota bacterium]|jgi:hypothetical protein
MRSRSSRAFGAAGVLAVACALSAGLPRSAAASGSSTTSTGEAEFTFTTSAFKGKYAPKHILAVWVTDAKGGFIKTVLLNAKSKKKYLKRWGDESGKNYVDAVTSATLKKHGAAVARWDCRDAKGKVVPDGEYLLHVEMASDHKTSVTTPKTHIAFTKGPKPATAKPKDLANMKDMKFVYTPPGGPKADRKSSRESAPQPASAAATRPAAAETR